MSTDPKDNIQEMEHELRQLDDDLDDAKAKRARLGEEPAAGEEAELPDPGPHDE